MDNNFYNEYLKSDKWCKKRMHIAKIHNYTCQNCGKKTFYMFHIHHLTYKHLGNERDDELVFLCKECHDKIHDKQNKTNHRKCKKCNGELKIKIYTNKSGKRQQGLYCIKCGKWDKFVTNRELGEYYHQGYIFENTFGSIKGTKLEKYLQ